MALLPATYLVIRAVYGSASALLATASVALSAGMIVTSTSARGYSMVILLVVLLLGLAEYLRRTGNLAAWVLFAVLGAIGGYTIPLMVYAFASVVAWLGLSAVAGDTRIPRGPFLRALAGAVAATGVMTAVLYAPVFVRSDLATLLASPTIASKVRPLPWAEVLAGNAEKAVDAWWRWTADLAPWLRGAWGWAPSPPLSFTGTCPASASPSRWR